MARAYFAVQAMAGAAWWVAVFASDHVRRWTLGDWDPALLVVPDLLLFVGASALAAVRGGHWPAAVAAVWTTTVTVALTAHAFVDRVAGWGVVLMALSTVGTLAAAVTIWRGRLPTEWFFVGPFAFHEAGERPGARHLRRSLAQVVVFWSVFFLLVPLALAGVEQHLHLGWPPLHAAGWDWIGATTFVAASGLGLWSCVAMALRGEGTPLPAETARRLVLAGPYRYVRNPMAVAGTLQTAGVGLWHGSWMVLAAAVAGAVTWNTCIRPGEEADLAARFGFDYERYRDDVRCWVPTPHHR